jgi:hypothetical protein
MAAKGSARSAISKARREIDRALFSSVDLLRLSDILCSFIAAARTK